jgi:hypothetical protein
MSIQEALGEAPNLHRRFDAVFLRPNRRPLHCSGTADGSGFRLSPSSGLVGKSKHLLLIGGTSVFGGSLKDDETVSHFLNLRSRDYEAYPVAYIGFGLQHAWIRLKQGNLPKQLRFRRGRAILLADEFSIRPISEAQKNLQYGSISTGGLKEATAEIPGELTPAQLAFAGRQFDEIEAEYRRQLDAEDFQILWTGNFATLKALRLLTKAKIELAPSFPAGDPSFSDPAMSRQFADYLFDHKLVGGRENLAVLPTAPAETKPPAGSGEEQLNEALGMVPNWHRAFEHHNVFFGGKNHGQVSEITPITADENGFRLGPHSRRPGKRGHFFLIGSSEIYGEGLKGEETIAELINQRSSRFEAYPIAYFGWGPQHSWIRFKVGDLPKQVPFTEGRAVLVLNDFTIGRIFGDPKSLLYAAQAPLLQEVSRGTFEVQGTFSTTGSWLQRAQINYCNPFYFCQSIVAMQEFKPKLSQLETAGRLLDDIDRMYRSQFKVEEFTILWNGSDKVMAALRPLTKVKLLRLPPLSVSPLGEPDAEGARQFVDFLFHQKLAN